ncbi:MAG: acyl-CoA dehydrogenase N-terminal domain-containing protein, partial [Aquabacterium sp.]|nr:acyl-CoA dehydrogenase N-terminal domain-containing protein [Aquabacterium sp.]
MSLRQTIDFMLYDWLRVEQLCDGPGHAEHSRETFDAVMNW